MCVHMCLLYVTGPQREKNESEKDKKDCRTIECTGKGVGGESKKMTKERRMKMKRKRDVT